MRAVLTSDREGRFFKYHNMDNELTKKLQDWLAEPSHDTEDDIIAGATMLLKLNRNRVLFNTILRNPKRYVKAIQYELGKFLKIRLDGLTTNEVERMDAELTPQVKAVVDAEPEENTEKPDEEKDLPIASGKRADHDSLPEDIKSIWQKNAERWKKIKELYNTLLPLKKPCDRYEYLKQMKELWYAYKADFATYDSYKAPVEGEHTESEGLKEMASSKDIGNARSYLSKMVKDDKLLNLRKASLAEGATEKEAKAYTTALENTQQRVRLLLDNNEPIGDDLKAKLTEAGVTFPEEQPSETVDPTADNTADDEQGQEG